MINTSGITATVEGTVGSKKQKFGTNCTEKESEEKSLYMSIILEFSACPVFSSWPSDGSNGPWSTHLGYTKYRKW